MTLANVNGSFGQDAVEGLAGATVREYKAEADVTPGTIVQVNLVNDVPMVKAVANAKDNVIGVAKNAAKAGESVQVVVDGPAYVRASSTSVAAKGPFSANTSGQATTASAVLNETIVGRALEATGTTANALKRVWVSPTSSAAS